MHKLFTRSILLGFVLFTSIMGVSVAQTTTASMSGLVTDNNGGPLPGAAVIAIHEPSGTQYGMATTAEGRFFLNGMRIGGPYTVKVSFVGFNAYEQTGIQLSLGKAFKVEIELQSGDIELDAVEVVSERSAVMSNERTGASTNVGDEMMRALPTISRSADDFTRMTPQSDGQSFGGRNNLYNNFSVDGSIFNNSFGLDAATPGGQTGAQPVSLDAIEQIEVSLAPYDVRQGGFTGAGVNAVTKSGTNEWEGTIYSYFQNEGMISEKIADAKFDNPDLNYNQSGFSVGGPIMKNKLFFFTNYERTRSASPGNTFRAAANDTEVAQALAGELTGVSRVLQSDLDMMSTLLQQAGYTTGAYENYTARSDNDKFLLKLDWNINQDNNFSIRYNLLRSYRDENPHPIAIAPSLRVPSVNTMQYDNSGYRIHNNFDSFVAELNSRFGNKASNKFQIGYTVFNDFRRIPTSTGDFEDVGQEMHYPMVDFTKDGTTYFSVGTEQFSAENRLDQKVFQITDDFSYYSGNHIITGGVSYEHFDFINDFNLQRYGYGNFSPDGAFTDIDAFRALYEADLVNGTTDALDVLNRWAQTGTDAEANPIKSTPVTVGQLSAYVQDEWQANDDLKFTLGVRMDMPIYMTDVAQNDQLFNFYNPNGDAFSGDTFVDRDGNPVQVDVTRFPNNKPLWSPRLGFNYNLNGEGKTQLRGGTGIFTGRIPFVWISNQAGNSQFDPFYTFQINTTGEDFKFPQVWRSNLAWDQALGNGWTSTVELIYTKDVNAVQHVNYNMTLPVGTAVDGRQIYAASGTDYANVNAPRIRAVWDDVIAPNNSFLDAGVISMENTKKGYNYSVTAQVTKTWTTGMFFNTAYTYTEVKDITSNPGEIAADAFQRNAVVGNPNNPELAYSKFGLKHRFIAVFGYSKQYGKADNGQSRFGTSFSVFYEAAQGNRFSYTYAGDMNLDGIGGNDLIYIPTSSEIGTNDFRFVDITDGGGTVLVSAAEQESAFEAYIQQDDYLKENRGSFAERNGALSPWYTQMDMKIVQDFHLYTKSGKKNTLQLSLDILNLGNLLSSDWGVRELPANPRMVEFVGYDATDTNVPTFNYNTSANKSFTNDTSLDSRWRMQVGLRYIFN